MAVLPYTERTRVVQPNRNDGTMSAMRDEMRAVEIDRFGGLEELSVRNVSVPEVEPNQILIRVESAGIGIWDLGELGGRIAQMYEIKPNFPWILGSEGAGRVVAVGDHVRGFRNGDRVYGHTWATNPKRGFFAEYIVLDAVGDSPTPSGLTSGAHPIPSNVTTEQAGALMIDGMTGFLALDQTLHMKPGEKLMVFGAGGGIGHLVVQLATRMGAHVFAVASGEDGVALARRLGAEAAVEGHHGDIVGSARKFAPDGFDAALFTANGEAADRALTTMRDGGRVTTPGGPGPALKVPPGVSMLSYEYKGYDHGSIGKLNELIESAPFEVYLGGKFSLDQAVEAHRALTSHHLGRLVLLPTLRSDRN
jgi:NADPH:quinone reductase